MKLCMTLLVRDEAAIIRENIEYHLDRGIDFIIATDNRSEDDTPKILKEYEKQGRLKYIYEPADDYSQDIWVTRMARMAFNEYQADWIMHTDADEFWWPEKGTIKSVLESCAEDTDGLSITRKNFMTPSSYDALLPMYRQLTLCQNRSVNPFGQPLPPKVCHRGFANVNIEQGNHEFKLDHRIAKIEKSTELLIFHFPLLDYASFEKKIVLGGAAYGRNERLPKQMGFIWRQLYEKLKTGELKDYYQQQVYNEDQLQGLIEDGQAEYDNRFKVYMEALMTKKI